MFEWKKDKMENLFVKGGVFMWPLLLLLVATLIIVIERWLYWIKTKLENDSSLRKSILESTRDFLDQPQTEQKTSDHSAKLALLALQSNKFEKLQIDNFIKQKQLKHNRFMRSLDVITSVAPLLGILGTIWGIINSFNLAGAIANIEPATAMIGMSEAFITTAFGLIVSLSALFAFNYYQSLIEKELMGNDIFLTKLYMQISKNE